ncbi:Dimethyl-sulfide monooxygenase [Tolypocladium ophioglossoides CBS 100239]|uniref:Dimethyl-sulfide monooxygenase n=1 Tax=Tolypocladium ophioglossoides (strain CBS 100239) TaxID=1163406 RepID=A0A0L0NAC9_TOLOC|nr:Dimethyl-sulfide monooxygenase [Tolypocladium ophioglossoides CBS 100239]
MASTTAQTDGNTKKLLILNAFVESCSGHQSTGLWQHPRDRSWNFNNVAHWVELAKLLERGKFHGVFIADVLGAYDVYKGPRNADPAVVSGAQWPVNEPLAVVPAMAAATKNLGFGVTVATTYEQPYHLARLLSTVDHLSGGRLGWNIVTGYLDSAARNLGYTEQPKHDERYVIAEEYVNVTYKLWQSSWRDDAVKLDRDNRVYTDPSLVRTIDHVGKYYTVPGPHICQPSPQRTPVIMQAGTSSSGKSFAAKHAEAIFVAGHSPSTVAKNVADIRAMAKSQFGRDPSSLKFLAMLCPIIGKTQDEADAKYRELLSYGSEDGALALFGGWTGIDLAQYGDDEELRHVESNAIRSAVEAWSKSTPGVSKWTKQTVANHIKVADEMERWVAEADVDGFNLAYALMPESFEEIIEYLLPVLRQRGIFWDDYAVEGGTYRENIYGHGSLRVLSQFGLNMVGWSDLTRHPLCAGEDVALEESGSPEHWQPAEYQLAGGYSVPHLLGHNEVLVKTAVIGLNPIDWKAPDYNFGIPEFPYVSGRECAGTVCRLGDSGSRIALRDRVGCVCMYYRDLRKGAYQQYVVALDFNIVRLPQNLFLEDAATLGVAFVTAALALGVCMGVNFSVLGGLDLFSIVRKVDRGEILEDVRQETLGSIQDHERARPGDWLVIWGGSSTSADLTIQLARLAGLKVLVVVDQAKHGLWLSRHAVIRPDILVDSQDPERADDIIRANVGDKLRFAIDTRGRDSASMLLDAFTPNGGL